MWSIHVPPFLHGFFRHSFTSKWTKVKVFVRILYFSYFWWWYILTREQFTSTKINKNEHILLLKCKRIQERLPTAQKKLLDSLQPLRSLRNFTLDVRSCFNEVFHDNNVEAPTINCLSLNNVLANLIMYWLQTFDIKKHCCAYFSDRIRLQTLVDIGMWTTPCCSHRYRC